MFTQLWTGALSNEKAAENLDKLGTPVISLAKKVLSLLA